MSAKFRSEISADCWENCKQNLSWGRVVRGSTFIDPAQPNPPNNWPDPTQTTARWTYGRNPTHRPTLPKRTPVHQTSIGLQ